MNNVMTAEQAFNYAMNKHPSLYASDNLEQAQYKFYDHIFNVNGNGYRDLEEFTNAFKVTKENESLLHEFPSKYIEPGDIYYGYTKTRTLGSGEHTFEMAESDSIVNGLFTKEEQGTHPEIKKFISINKDERVPYPNFEKNYSMVWNMDMSQLDISWTKAAIWYYEKSKEFFNSDKIHLYHYAYPQDEKNKKS